MHKRTLKRMPTIVWQWIDEKQPEGVVLDFIRTARAGKRPKKREHEEEEEAEMDDRWGLEEGKLERDDEIDEREEGEGRRVQEGGRTIM